MTKKVISFGKIKQFRNVIKGVSDQSAYVGQDENDEAIYDYNLPKPVLTFKGTIKTHGSLSKVSFSEPDGFWPQSKNRILTKTSDNAGFANFIYQKEDVVLELLNKVIIDNDVNTSTHVTTIFGEWCGGNVQGGVAISGLPKMWMIFAAKISPIEQLDDDDECAVWADHKNLRNKDELIFNILDFPTFEVEVDFNNPTEANNKIVEMVLEVEKECPVGKQFGRILGENNTTGEGIVFVADYRGTKIRFKSKGDKHAGKSKIKIQKATDPIEDANKVKFLEVVMTEERMVQGWQEVFGINNEKTSPDVKLMGSFLKWVANDIFIEEEQLLTELKLEPSRISRDISKIARVWFFTELDRESGL